MQRDSKILILTTVHSYNDVRIFFKEALSLKKRFNDNICLMAPIDSKIKNFEVEGINILPLPRTKNRFLRIFKIQYLAFKRIKKRKFDLVHFHDPELILLAYILKKFFEVKIIFDVHENVTASIDVRTWIPKIFRRLLKVAYSSVESILIKSFDSIIIAETSYREIYGDKSVEVLNYPILTKIVQKENKSFNEEINLIYGGGITEVRGIWQMLESFKIIQNSFKNCYLHFAGKIESDELRDKVEDFIFSNALQKHVILYGQLDVDELYKVMKNCHIGLALLKPVKHHTGKLPGKIFDYFHMGLPVIVSDFSIYSNFIHHKVTGMLVDYNNIDDIAKNILELINDRELLKNMSKNCKEHAKDKWIWEEEEKKLYKIYENLGFD